MSKVKDQSADPEIPRILWNGKDNYRVHKSPLLDHNLSHMNPFHIQPQYFFTILPSTPRSPTS